MERKFAAASHSAATVDLQCQKNLFAYRFSRGPTRKGVKTLFFRSLFNNFTAPSRTLCLILTKFNKNNF